MDIQISEQASDKIRAIIGSSDQAVIQRIVEQVASDEHLLRSLVFGPASKADIQAVREGLEDLDAGRSRPFAEFDEEFRKEMGFAPWSDS